MDSSTTDSINPYQSPLSGVIESDRLFVSRWKRFVNHFVDGFLGFMISGFPVRFVELALVPYFSRTARESVPWGLAFWAAQMTLWFVYYAVSEIVWQRTAGKLVTGTYVASADGSRPSIRQILVRTLCRYIPFESLSFLVSDVGCHDFLSGTRVLEMSTQPEWE